jgi:hypothetical protein
MSVLRVWCVGCLILYCMLPASVHHAELLELPTRLQANGLTQEGHIQVPYSIRTIFGPWHSVGRAR